VVAGREIRIPSRELVTRCTTGNRQQATGLIFSTDLSDSDCTIIPCEYFHIIIGTFNTHVLILIHKMFKKKYIMYE